MDYKIDIRDVLNPWLVSAPGLVIVTQGLVLSNSQLSNLHKSYSILFLLHNVKSWQDEQEPITPTI